MGITSESQLIDINTIAAGCNSFISALEIFINGANRIVEAGSLCDGKALSIDGKTLQPEITEIGTQIGNLYNEYANCAQDVYNQAVRIYEQQVAELNEYYRQQAAAQQQNNR